MNDFQKSVDKCLSELFKQDPTRYLTTGFNALITTHFPAIIKAYGKTTTLFNGLKYTFSVSDLITYNAPTTNSDCFDFGISQCVMVTGKLMLTVIAKSQEGLREPDILSTVRTPIFKLPICGGRHILYTPSFDDPNLQNQWLPSGHLICHGKLRALPAVKVMRNNQILLIRKKQFVKLQVRSAHHSKPFRSTSSVDFVIMNTNKKSSAEGFVGCALPFSTHSIHIGILAQALGCPPKTFILLMKSMMGDLYDPIVFLPYEISLMYNEDVLKATTQEIATIMISKLFAKARHLTGLNQVKTELFPHLNIGFDEVNEVEQLHRAKLLYLTRCTGLVILFAAKKIEETPRDFFRYSSIITPAHYIGSLVRKLFINHMKTTQKLLRGALKFMFLKPPSQQNFIDLVKLFGEPRLSSRIISPIANGSWGPTNKGVTISLNSGNPDGFISELTRFSSSLKITDSMNTEPRQVQMDGCGYVCASSSPDGENVGLTMQFACLATVTIDFEQPKILADLLEILFNDLLISVNDVLGSSLDQAFINSNDSLNEKTIDFLNSSRFYSYYNNCGIHSHYLPIEKFDIFVAKFRRLRRRGNIPQFTFLEKYDVRKEIHIINLGGQIVRPMIVAENFHLIHKDMSLFDMLTNGIVEYLNSAEEQTICFAACSYDNYKLSLTSPSHKKVTHIDLSEAFFVSQQVATVPFLTSQHGPRTAYYAQQVKQHITADIKQRWGAVLNTQLYYGFHSLVKTLSGIHMPQQCLGRDQPALIAFYATDNQEDSMVFCKSPLDRGMFNAFTTRYYSSDASPPNGTQHCKEKFEKPKSALAMKKDYSNVQDDGTPAIGTFIPGGGLTLAKTKTTKTNLFSNKDGTNNNNNKSILRTRDISTNSRLDESGYVTNVSKFSTPNGEKVTVEIETPRPPIVGDKFTTRFSGKGVINAIVQQEDLIYSLETGQSPDIIVAPPSVASRMTVSSLLETITGKAVSISGDLSKGIDFHAYESLNQDRYHDLGKIMHTYGFTCNGFETYIDGKTGEFIKCRIFTGIVDVGRLIHLASKKLHARDFGPRDPSTRQPRIGRLKGGGMKVGEMETSAISSHGAAHNLQTRLKDLSDPFFVHICSKCKMLAEGNEEIGYTWCRGCRSKRNIYLVSITFTFLVAITELTAMGIVVRIAVKPDDLQLKKKQPCWSEDVWLNAFEQDTFDMNSLCI